MKNVRLGILVCIVMMPWRLIAQESGHWGSYQAISFEIPFGSKWSIFNEDEFRSTRLFNHYFYNELKAGVGYKYSKKLSLAVGFGFYNTFRGGEDYDNLKEKIDYKFLQQANYKHPFFGGILEHRLRVEELLNDRLRPSFRYRIQPKWPLNKKDFTSGNLFGSVYDEIFLQTTAPVFKRNRIYAGLGYYLSDDFNIQLGILRQTDYSLSPPHFHKNFLYCSGSLRF